MDTRTADSGSEVLSEDGDGQGNSDALSLLDKLEQLDTATKKKSNPKKRAKKEGVRFLILFVSTSC